MKIKLASLTIDLSHVIHSLIYILIGILIFQLLKRVINKMVEGKRPLKASQQQRVKTISSLLKNIVKYIIIIVVIISVLAAFGVNVKSIVAGLGIGGALLGLAFQDLAKDLIAGFSIITEGEYEVGDTIEADGFMGEVISIGLRTTRIRNFKGATKIIANHYMDNVINYSNNNSLAVVDVSIAYECDEKKIEETFDKLFKKLNGNMEFATKDLELWGVNDLGDSGVVYRVVVETKPMKQFITERFLRKEIKKAFDEVGIKIPYTQIEVHNGK